MRARDRATSCVDGRLMRHDPQPDDPSLQTDVGQCPDCGGRGCDVCEFCGRKMQGGECEHCETAREEGEAYAVEHGMPDFRGGNDDQR